MKVTFFNIRIPSEFTLYNNLSKPDAYAQNYVDTAYSEGDVNKIFF